MKFSTIVFALASAAVIMAQRSFIASPLNGTTVKAGSELVVQLVRPLSIQGSIEVGVVIGLQSCWENSSASCAPPQQQVGQVLFNGQFSPVFHERPGQPYENFTVTIPTADYLQSNAAQLGVDRFHLIGAGPVPVLELNNITLNIVG